MKTKAVPAVIMLTAGLIDCILSIYCQLSLWRFTWQLLVVLVIFYILGCVVQIILDKNFAGMQETEEPVEENAKGDEPGDAPEAENAQEKSVQDTVKEEN